MKVTAVETIRLGEFPNVLWVQVHTDEGLVGLGETFMGSTGNNMNYNNMMMAENEERSIWEPFHVQKGFKPEESVVSTFTGWSLINHNGGSALNNQDVIKRVLPSLLSSGTGSGTQATLLLDPLIARDLRE